MYRSRGTIETKNAGYATKNRQLKAPVRMATTYSCPMERTPAQEARGTVRRRRARARSAAIMSFRRSPRRSTQAPAWSDRKRYGSHAAAERYPISAGPA